MMLESLMAAVVTAATGGVAEVLLQTVRAYLKTKGQKLSETPTEEEIAKSFAALEARESSSEAVVDAQNIFESAITQLSAFRLERERQARNSYNLAWGVLVSGSALVLAGIAWMGIGSSITAGIVTSAVGAITSLCSGVIFKFSNDANNRLDEFATNLHRIESTRMALEVVQKISKEDERNAAIGQIVSSLSQTQRVVKPRKRAVASREVSNGRNSPTITYNRKGQ